MAAGSYSFYDSFKHYLANGTIDWDSAVADTLTMALVTSLYTFDATDTVYADITNELATANGYTAGGAAVASQSVEAVPTGAGCDLLVGDVSWTAAGGSLVARRGILYVNDTVNGIIKPLIGSFLLDATPADVTINDGTTFTINGHTVCTLT